MSVVTIEINGVKKELNHGDVIFCSTKEEAKVLFKAFTAVDYKWCSGDKIEGSDPYMDKCGHAYLINSGGLEHSELEWYQENTDYYSGNQYNIMYFEDLFTPKKSVDPNELYEIIKKIYESPIEGGMNISEVYECFNDGLCEILSSNTPESLVEKYNAWIKSKEEIKVGDIFEFTSYNEKDQYIIIYVDHGSTPEYTVLWDDGSIGHWGKVAILEDKKVGHKDLLNLFD